MQITSAYLSDPLSAHLAQARTILRAYIDDQVHAHLAGETCERRPRRRVLAELQPGDNRLRDA